MGTRTFAKLTVNQGIGENFAAKAHAMLGRTSGCAFGVKALKADLWARGHGGWVYREFISCS